MLKSDVLDDLIDYFIRKAMEGESELEKSTTNKRIITKKTIRGDKENGLYATAGIRKQA